jgi:(1->4)-alpha-D-glucan 1-alpha-D-glucosylmutase
VDELSAAWPDPRMKMLLIWRALAFRRANAELFLHGRYVPLAVEGPQSERICAFAREHAGRWAVCAVPRLAVQAWVREPALVAAGAAVADAGSAGQDLPEVRAVGPVPAAWFAETLVRLPPEVPETWRNVVTGEHLSNTGPVAMGRQLDAAELFRRFPVALLSGE